MSDERDPEAALTRFLSELSPQQRASVPHLLARMCREEQEAGTVFALEMYEHQLQSDASSPVAEAFHEAGHLGGDRTTRTLRARSARHELRRERDRQRRKAERLPAGTVETEDGTLLLPGEPATWPESITTSPVDEPTEIDRWARSRLGGVLFESAFSDRITEAESASTKRAFEAYFGYPAEAAWQRLIRVFVREALRRNLARRLKGSTVSGMDILVQLRRTSVPLPSALSVGMLGDVLSRSTVSGGNGSKRNYHNVIDDLIRSLGEKPHPFPR